MVRFPSIELAESQPLLSALFDHSKVGLAVFDQHGRYLLVNPYLAILNSTSIEGNMGKHVCEILGSVGGLVERGIKKVFATAKPLLNCEVAGALPGKKHGTRLYSLFPIMNANGSVAQVGAVVVELGADVTTDQVLPRLTSRILRSWKEIAQHVGTSVKTVQRWELTQDFPVHRVNPKKGSVVFSLQNEVDDWLRKRH